jgi:YesN/AraC family two-component response regulator
MQKKMGYAAHLLKQGITDSYASEAIGYSNSIKFNKIFQKYFGTTPYEYKKAHSS